jgi:hypothetical protein
MLASERNALINEIDAAKLAVDAAKLGDPSRGDPTPRPPTQDADEV